MISLGLALAGCGQAQVEDKATEARKASEQKAYAAAEGAVPCAMAGEREFRPVCRIDRANTQDGLYLTIRHPDGGFRRLLVTRDGRGVVAADGAQTAFVHPLGAREIEVVLGDVRYRLPATVRAGLHQ
jgi:hypothetical protein